MTATGVIDEDAVEVPASPLIALARREAGRMLGHPSYLAALGIVAIVIGQWVATSPELRRPAALIYVVLEFGITFAYAPTTIIAANRVARSTQRDGLRDQMRSAPVNLRRRTLALCAGVTIGPTALALVGAVAALTLSPHADVATGSGMASDIVGRGVAALVQLPILTWSAGMLGILIARWLPYPGALPVSLILVYQICAYDTEPLVWFKPWHDWYIASTGGTGELAVAQDAWHALYLLGLGSLACIGGVWRTPGPKKPLVVVGTVLLVVTVVAGIAQLP